MASLLGWQSGDFLLVLALVEVKFHYTYFPALQDVPLTTFRLPYDNCPECREYRLWNQVESAGCDPSVSGIRKHHRLHCLDHSHGCVQRFYRKRHPQSSICLEADDGHRYVHIMEECPGRATEFDHAIGLIPCALTVYGRLTMNETEAYARCKSRENKDVLKQRLITEMSKITDKSSPPPSLALCASSGMIFVYISQTGGMPPHSSPSAWRGFSSMCTIILVALLC